MPQRYSSSGVFPQDFSDHCPIACIRNVKLHWTTPRITSKRNFSKFDTHGFLHDLNVCDLSLITDPELTLAYFSNAFNTLADKHAPFRRLWIKDRHTVWFSQEHSEVITERNSARAKARKTGDCFGLDFVQTAAKQMYYYDQKN